MKNKKAQVQYGLIFLVAIGLCVFAGRAMLSFSGNLDFQSEEISQMLYRADFNKAYVLEQTKILSKETILNCLECPEPGLKQELQKTAQEKENQFRYEGSGNFYAKIRNSQIDKFQFDQEAEQYTLNLTGLFIQAKTLNENSQVTNQITRNFDLCMLFDRNGNYLSWCR